MGKQGENMREEEGAEVKGRIQRKDWRRGREEKEGWRKANQMPGRSL